MSYKLQDLIDMEQFQNLQNWLDEIYPFPSAIIDNEGNVLTATGWQDICTQFHRKNPACLLDCIHSDQYIQAHMHEASPVVSYLCPRGLVDNAMPIVINGVHYANFFTGQFFLEKPDREFFRNQARIYGFDETAYLEAVDRVPIWTKKQLNTYFDFIKGLIQIITDSGLKRIREIEAKKQIEASEERDNLIFRQMNDGFVILNAQDGRVMDVNAAMCAMLGRERDEILNMTVADVGAGGNEVLIRQMFERAIQVGSSQFEISLSHKDGSLFDGEISLTYLPKREMLFGLCRNISERKQAEKVLRESKEWHHIFLETAMEGFWQADAAGRLVEVNETYCRMSGYTADELLNMHINDVEVIEDADATALRLQKIFETGEDRFETRHRRKDGSVMDVEVSVQFKAKDGGRFVAFLRDITERKTAQEAQIQSAETLHAILTATTEAVYLMKVDGEIILANETGGLRLGRKPADLIGLNAFELLPSDVAEERKRQVKTLIRERAPVHFEDKRSGMWIENNIYPIFDLDGQIRRVAIYGRNITERKLAEEEIYKAQNELTSLLHETEHSRRALLSVVEDQKAAQYQIRNLNAELEKRVKERTAQLEELNHEMEAFSYSVSHDLRAPLRALEGFSTVLMEDYADQLDDLGKNYLTRIQNASRRMAQLIDDLLNLSRITRHEVSIGSVDLSALARQIEADLHEQFPDRRVRFDIHPNLLVQADPNLMKIALENLLFNAFKFTSKREIAKIQLGMIEKSGSNIYFVSDNGAGFDMAYAEKLFKPFQRLHGSSEYPGTGIGLTIVHRIIARHRGRIWPEAVPGQGAVFYFTLASEK